MRGSRTSARDIGVDGVRLFLPVCVSPCLAVPSVARSAMRSPWSWRAKASSWSGWRGRGLRRRSSWRGRGARVVATDGKPEGELPAEVAEAGASRACGWSWAAIARRRSPAPTWWWCRPGVPWDLPELQAARAAGVPVMAELELGFRQLQGTVAAVTGTKGKSTTTAALGAMLPRGGRRRARGRQHRPAPSAALRGGRDRRHARSCSRCRASSSRARDTFHPQRGRLPEPLRRPPRPPRQLRGVRGGQGAHLRQPDRGGLGGGQRRRPRRCCALARGPRARAAALRVAARRATRTARSSRAARRGCAATARTRDALPPRRTCACPAPTWPLDLLAAAAAARLAGRAGRGHPARGRARLPRRRARAGARGGRSAASPSSTTPRPPTWTRRARAWRPSTGRVLRHPGRPLQGRRLRRPAPPPLAAPRQGGAGHRRGARTAWREALAATRARSSPATSLREAVERALRARAAPATPSCWPPPARRSTCSATTPTAAAPSRTRCGAAGRSRRRRRRRTRTMAKKLSSDTHAVRGHRGAARRWAW